MKSLRVVLLALVVATASLSGLAVQAPKAEAAVTRTYYASGALVCGLSACKVTVNGQFSVIDNSRMRLDWGGCQTSWAYGVTVNYSWRGTYFDPAGRWMEVGCNFSVDALVKGSPLSTGFYIRLRAYPNGYAYMYWGRL